MAQAQPIRSPFLNGEAPTKCANCREPFPIVGNHIGAWRQGAFYFCSEFCADDFVEPTPAARAH